MPATEGDAKFRLMFERSADAILLLDTATNQFVEYNQATLDLLRCTREELSVLHPSALSPPRQPDGRESFEKANEMIARAVRTGSHRFEWVHRSPHREDFPVEVLLTPLPLGDTPLVVVVWRDISERKRSEEALREAQKRESIAVLAGGVAHDFNNLLAATTAHLELAQLEATGRVAEHLTVMEQALRSAADLTRQMLAYSGRGRFVVEPLQLSELVRQMVGLLEVSVPKHARLACEIEDGLPLIEADRSQAQQVLMNLITNAGEAIGERTEGRITVRVRRAELDADTIGREFVGQSIRPGPAVLLEVTDNGRGMTPEVQARIFDPFFSTKAAGRGLGLSAMQGILKSHGAALRVRSEAGKGTTFEVFFPASTASPTIEPTLPATKAWRPGGGTVLLVDDEPLLRKSLRLLLEHLEFTVIEAADGREAISTFERDRHRISWVLMDLTMPRLDGHATFLKLRELDPEVIVVLSSGWTATEIATRFGENVPAGFLPKPFSLAQLQTMVLSLGLTPSPAAE